MKFLLIIILLLGIIGCKANTMMDCKDLMITVPEQGDFDDLTLDTIADWVQQNYQIPAHEVSISNLSDYQTPIADVSWQTSYGMYQGDFEDNYLFNIRLTWGGSYLPSVKDIVNCLGNPQYYRALYVPKQFELLLIYPEQGLVVGSSSHTIFNTPPSSVENIPVEYFIFVRPDDLEMVLSDAYPNNEGNLQFNLENSHEWTGWSDIIVIQ